LLQNQFLIAAANNSTPLVGLHLLPAILTAIDLIARMPPIFTATTTLFWLPLTLLLAVSSLNTKAPGLAWLLFILAGLWAWWQSRHPAAAIAPVARPAPTAPEAIHAGIAKIWLITTAAALLLKTIPMIYWADPWGERHAEFRLLLGALGLYGLCQLPLERLRRHYLNGAYFAWVGSGLAIGCLLALWLVLSKGSVAAPTNRLPWASALAISACVLLALARVVSNWRLRYFWLAASGAGLLAVLASDVRGAYGLALVWPALAFYLFKVKPTATVPHVHLKTALLVLAAVLVVAVLIPTRFVQQPLQRMQIAWPEFESSQMSAAQGANTSVGARLYMWQRSLGAIAESPWIGYGRAGRMAHIQQWGDEVTSPVVKSLGHLHNEYLQTLLDHGLWGLASLLSYSLGILLMARKLRASHDTGQKALAAGLTGVVLMLMSSGLSNMNFAHNYYPTVLSLAITLLVCAAACRVTPRQALAG
jgi:O-antigen ligase